MRRARLDTVTVMFTDLVDSTALRARVGEERADELRVEHDTILSRIIADSGGEIVKHLGDGMMAMFPSATEAVGAGVDIQRALQRRNRMSDDVLMVRVGLSTGDVSAEDDDYFGLPVVEAQRLESSAQPGQVLCSELVAEVTRGRGGHEFKPVGELELKGIDEPVAALEVVWETSTSGRSVGEIPEVVDAARAGPLVGRAEELQRLLGVLDDVERGDGRAVFIGGEPGIGKTRLVSEVASQLHRDGGLVLTGSCDSALRSPFRPFIEALRWYIAHSPDDELSLVLGGANAQLVQLVPELGSRLPDAEPAQHSDADAERQMLFDAAASWLARLGERHPVCLFLDDLQWADEASLLLLRHLALRTPQRVLVMGTYRHADVATGGMLDELLFDPRRKDEPLVLGGLDEPAIAELLGEGDQERVGAIATRTAGNPLFVVEIARMRDESVGGELPESVRDSVVRRAAVHGDSALDLLRTASVVGRDFGLDMVAKLDGRDVGKVLADLEAALTSQLVVERGPGAYGFSHDLVQEALYESLSSTRRAVVHHEIAELLAQKPGTDAAALAGHFRMAAPVFGAEAAVVSAVDAGIDTLARSPHDAIHWLTQALDMAAEADIHIDRPAVLLALGKAELRAGHPGHATRLLEAADAAEEAGDAARMAEALIASGRLGFTTASDPDPAKVDRLRRCLDLLADGPPALRAEVLSTLALELVFLGEVDERRQLLDEAAELALESGELATMVRVFMRVDQAYPRRRRRGEWHDRFADDYRRILDRVEELDDTSLYIEALNDALFWRFATDDIAGARAAAATIATLATERRDPFAQRYVEVSGPLLAFVDGDLDGSERQALAQLDKWTREGFEEAIGYHAVETFALRREQGRLAEFAADNAGVVRLFPPTSTALAMLGVALVESGDPRSARRVLDAAMADGLDTIADDAVWGITVALWADLAAQLDDESAAAVLREHWGYYDAVHVLTGGLYLGARAHYQGLLDSTLGRGDDASAHFEDAVATAGRAGSAGWVARSELAWARHLRTNGDEAGAVACARRALDAIGDLPFDVSRHRARLFTVV